MLDRAAHWHFFAFRAAKLAAVSSTKIPCSACSLQRQNPALLERISTCSQNWISSNVLFKTKPNKSTNFAHTEIQTGSGSTLWNIAKSQQLDIWQAILPLTDW